MTTFSCGQRIICSLDGFVVCGNPEHAEWGGADPVDVMALHRAQMHPNA
jgi:hypothetical protein